MSSNGARQCEQCGRVAECYAGGIGANDWAGAYCFACAKSLRFVVFDYYKQQTTTNTEGK